MIKKKFNGSKILFLSLRNIQCRSNRFIIGEALREWDEYIVYLHPCCEYFYTWIILYYNYWEGGPMLLRHCIWNELTLCFSNVNQFWTEANGENASSWKQRFKFLRMLLGLSFHALNILNKILEIYFSFQWFFGEWFYFYFSNLQLLQSME